MWSAFFMLCLFCSPVSLFDYTVVNSTAHCIDQCKSISIHFFIEPDALKRNHMAMSLRTAT